MEDDELAGKLWNGKSFEKFAKNSGILEQVSVHFLRTRI